MARQCEIIHSVFLSMQGAHPFSCLHGASIHTNTNFYFMHNIIQIILKFWRVKFLIFAGRVKLLYNLLIQGFLRVAPWQPGLNKSARIPY